MVVRLVHSQAMSGDRPEAMQAGPCPSCGQELQGHEFSLVAGGSWMAQCTSCGAQVAWAQVRRVVDLRETVLT